MNGVLFSATWACDSQEKGAGYVALYIASYMVIADSSTAGDNQPHDSVITPLLELARTYNNKIIFTRVI